jgi:tetratricopeptide (TPR) repeat protein
LKSFKFKIFTLIIIAVILVILPSLNEKILAQNDNNENKTNMLFKNNTIPNISNSSINNPFTSNMTFDKAIELYDRVLAIKPNDTDTLTNKGIVLIKQQKYDDAIAIFNKVLELKPDNVPSLYHMGLALENKGERYDGTLYKNQALELDPQYKPDYINQVAKAVDVSEVEQLVTKPLEYKNKTMGTRK